MKLSKPVAITVHHSVTAEQPEIDVWNMIKSIGIRAHGVPDYHFGVGASGNIYVGCPMDTVAAHCGLDMGEDYSPYGVYNQNSFAICAIGNFEINYMKEAQIKGIVKCIQNILAKYPGLTIYQHKKLVATACPGRLYPYTEIIKRVGEKMEVKIKVGSDSHYATVDGKQVDMGMHPVPINGVTLIPIRFISEIFGAQVLWDGNTKTITLKK